MIYLFNKIDNRSLITLLLLGFPLWQSCAEFNSQKEEFKKKTAPIIKSQPYDKRLVLIMPLGKVNSLYVQWIEESIKETFKMQVKIEKSLPIKSSYYYNIEGKKNRINAPKIIDIFKSTKEIPIIITESDIAHDKKQNGKEIKGYGIVGLGRRPISLNQMSSTCIIISTYRIKNKSLEVFQNRIKKVTIHEVGHNLTLRHCKKQINCVMIDAQGKVSTIDNAQYKFCQNCAHLIEPYLK